MTPTSRRSCARVCGAELAEQARAPVPSRPPPIGGSSTIKWAETGQKRNRRKGAAGEYLMDLRLHSDLTNGEVILNDRRIPDGYGNIDHVVVAPSGVWIIDSKSWSGRIEYRGVKGVFDPIEHLFVGEKDCTYLVDDIYAQVIPVAALINDRAVPIRPAIVFLEGDWKSTWRLLRNKPYVHKHVVIAWPSALISKINEPGPLTPNVIEEIGHDLDQRLAAM